MSNEVVNAEALLSQLAAADNVVATKTGALKHAQEEYEAIKDRLMAYLDEQGLSGMDNKKLGIEVSINEVPKYGFEDFDVFVRFLLRNKAVELLHRRLADRAVAAMIEQRKGKAIPGLKVYNVRRLHVTKSKGA